MAIISFLALVATGMVVGHHYGEWEKAIDPATLDALFWLYVYMNCLALYLAACIQRNKRA